MKDNLMKMSVIVYAFLLILILMDNAFPSYAIRGKLLFVKYEAANEPWLFIIDADGHRMTRLFRHRSNWYSYSLSPDCEKIAFQAFPEGGTWGDPEDIYIIDADGSNRRKLTDSKWNEILPRWSGLSRILCKNLGIS
jgi:Tol biopolymer transport system component